MKIEFMPLSAELLPACREFNQRMLNHGEPPFLLPEKMRLVAPTPDAAIAWNHYLAVDEGGAVRGGVLLMEQRGWLNGRDISVINVQSPLTEGIADRAYSGVALRMLQFLSRRNPYAYAVGMGSEQNSFARLLKAAGWAIHRVPFQFDVIHASSFLREIAPLRYGRKRIFARLAAASGAGSAASALWRGIHKRSPSRRYSFEPTAVWPEAELDAVWARCRAGLDFSVVRNGRGVIDLHPYPQSRLKKFLLRENGQLVGWAVGVVTRMAKDSHFGELMVGTILDALAPPEHLRDLLARTRDALCDLNADLVISNQMHELWQNTFRRLGFISGPSNYVLAMSKLLASELQDQTTISHRIYVSRGDGDGRINL